VFIFDGCAAPAIWSAWNCRTSSAVAVSGERVSDIVVLGLVDEVAVRHVLQHAAAQITDGLLEYRVGHRVLLS
jgi:hypothetical protein